MNYLQIGVLSIIALVIFIIWWVCFVDINKDITYQNKRTGTTRAKPKRKKMKGQSAAGAYMPSIMGESPNVMSNIDRGARNNGSRDNRRYESQRQGSGSRSNNKNHLKVYNSSGVERKPQPKRPPRER